MDYCFDYNKEEQENWKSGNRGMLGMPALILLSAIIDTMGAYFRGTNLEIDVDGQKKKIETASDHFLILNDKLLFGLNLTEPVISDFYKKYRSVATHNSTLPPFQFMDIGIKSDEIFKFNSLGEIEKLMLKPLFEAVKKASATFVHWLQFGGWSAAHKLAKELSEKSGIITQPQQSTTLTGSTQNFGSVNPTSNT
ncbi:hypothetical protein BDD43_2989 [Mucilaginibacter gracilis]|uniref:Uncharacterized protein n=1 Tax=Mucilaginibacter gracilis TaxID=423350 RepID=A0A495J1F1_9SPHI|nr:hypothetical protein [Mucilaginibacter gracilis]RKR82800.1 hypothetical protein BDD43_2989 [Mucilaginibacter gracilis]